MAKTRTERGAAGTLLAWLPAVAWMGLLFYASSLPGDEIRLPDFRFSDKAVHFLAYAGLGALLAARRRGSWPAFDGTAVMVGVLYGVSDEIHQLFVPLRQFDYADMAADALGVIAGSCLLLGVMRSRVRARALA